jgi:hypothetical protein
MKSPQPEKPNHRMAQIRPDGMAALRVWSIPATKRKSPRLRIKCGCCDQQVVIYHDAEGEHLEINGVIGSVENWREVLLPLLAPSATSSTPPTTSPPRK